MTKAQAQSMAHELTLEYIRIHTDILSCNVEEIVAAVDKIAEVNVAFYEALSKNGKFDKAYL